MIGKEDAHVWVPFRIPSLCPSSAVVCVTRTDECNATERAGVPAAESPLFKAEIQNNMHLKGNVQGWILWTPACCWSGEAESEPWGPLWRPRAARVNPPRGERSAASPKGLSGR